MRKKTFIQFFIIIVLVVSVGFLADVLRKTTFRQEQIVIVVPEEIEEPEVIKEAYQEVTATIYAYNSEISQTDSDPLIMASGAVVYDGAIACPSFIKLKTAIEIDNKIYICEDRMGWRYRNDYNFDIWMLYKQDALNWGVQEKLIKIYN